MEEKKKRRRRRRKLWQMSRKEEEVKAEAVVVNDPIADIEAEDITAPEAESEDIQVRCFTRGKRKVKSGTSNY
jgi:hypothetical protein